MVNGDPSEIFINTPPLLKFLSFYIGEERSYYGRVVWECRKAERGRDWGPTKERARRDPKQPESYR